MLKDPVLDILSKDARVSLESLADQSALTVDAVAAKIEEYQKRGVILGFQAVLDEDKVGSQDVSALIEVRVTPERGGGFDRLAQRISRFDQVVSCWLMSGGYDLAVIVKATDLRGVASFVSQKLSTLDGVLSTATHFKLKSYKDGGFLANVDSESDRLPVTP
ncbi:Lrp/AsnC family transcriptional regulator [Sulfuriroseicoccus oceanibius]|uniref:Lrp/AsnC family transcriptional regulator n=1 Tax=Sulfuriroseicoccus oceanibius TaxID=2707525 RepID=A0A6B3L4N6_9BACT|nr:Lrp/AsnC family transcriptional regulator [Sulfuriroseicoccus oceanibius]QQL43768.1 Lrp/AsnC family transcriptional regulator [Sulfuriroseicoccus oceanibius]